MKQFVIRFCYHVLGFLGLASAYSCSEGGLIFTGADEYGTPYAEFEIKGVVTDGQGEPLKGIEVRCNEVYISMETVYTDAEGRFVLSDGSFPTNSISLDFKDIDGELNGGEFETKTVEVSLEKIADGNGNWDFGFYGAEVEVQMSLKESE